MKKFMTPLAVLLGLTGGQAMAGETANPLEIERWQNRPLIVVAPEAGDPTLRHFQQDLLVPANREAFVERDMVLYTVVGGVGKRNGQAMDPAATQALLNELGVDGQGPTRLLLVGKDGGTKIDQRAPLDPKAIFATIDRMPMRRQP